MRQPTTAGKLTPEEIEVAKKLLACAELLNNSARITTIRQLRTLLFVAIEQGKTIGHYVNASAQRSGVTSKHILDLSTVVREGHVGCGLVVLKQHDKDYRSNVVELAPKGADLFRRLSTIFGGPK